MASEEDWLGAALPDLPSEKDGLMLRRAMMPLTAWNGMSVCNGKTGGSGFSAAFRSSLRRLLGDLFTLHSIYRCDSVASVVENVQTQTNG